MAGDVDNPRIWEGADLYVGDLGATAPTDTTTAWGNDWDALGLLSEDGFTFGRDQSVAEHYAWGSILVRTSKSKHKRTFKATVLEDTAIVFGLVNPGSEYEDLGGGVTERTIKVPSGQDLRAFGLEIRDGDITSRIVVPRGEVIEVGELKYGPDEMATRELTVNIYPDDDSIWYYELTDDPQALTS